MCGITGAIRFQPNTTTAGFEQSLNQLRHRGPDDCGTWTNHTVFLGHTRLSIIDLAHGHQPLSNRGRDLHLVTNGEVYNYKEIAKAHPSISEQSLTQSDSEAILQAYTASGEDGLKALHGMYAFALYDSRRDITILCRDRLGIKPLFFAQTKDAIVFASEIKAILPYLDKSPDVNPRALTQFLQHQFSTGRDTIISGIQRVLPGEYLVVKGGQITFKQYWDPVTVTKNNLSLAQAIESYEPLFSEVMSQHMRADVPFGLFLSGGIDSSILLAKLSALHHQPLKTYSIGFSGTTMNDELEAANALASHFNTEHTPIRVTREQLFERIVHSIWAADDLMRDYASLPTHLLSERAAEDVKIVFSGEGGDEAFAGYRRYAPTVGRKLLHTLLRQDVRVHNQWSKQAKQWVFQDRLNTQISRDEFIDAWRRAPASWSVMQKRQYVDIKTALADNLFVKTDRMMMAFGLEGRVPFSDHRLVEFGLALPDRVKYQHSRGKYLLREWAKSNLPVDHLAKPKRGFHVPIKEWLSGDFLHQLTQVLPENQAIKAWFNPNGVKQLLTAQAKQQRYSREVWGLMQFAIWHRLFIENPGHTPGIKEDPLDWL